MKLIPEYYTLLDHVDIRLATNPQDLLQIALRVLKRMPQPVGQVCGPLNSGGLGSFDANLVEMDRIIRLLSISGKTIFTQIPFEGTMQKIQGTPGCPTGPYLLENFYRPIFESGLVRDLYFMKGWQTSFGATWEHMVAFELHLQIHEL